MKKLTRPSFSMIGEHGLTDDHAIVKPELHLEQLSSSNKTIISGYVDVEEGTLTLIKANGEKIRIEAILSYTDLIEGQQGPTGEPGRDGKDGKDGKDGAEGLQGCTGEKGDSGLDGPTGRMGKRGEPGPPGPFGDVGPDGPPGPPGPIGPSGPPGEKGPPGPAGNDGPKGERGLSMVGVECKDNVLRLLMSDGSEHTTNIPDPALCIGHLAYERQDWDNAVQTYGYIIERKSGDTIINILQNRLKEDTGITFSLSTIAMVYNQYILSILDGGLGRPPDYVGLREWCKFIEHSPFKRVDFLKQFAVQDEFKHYSALGIAYQQILPVQECLTLDGINYWPELVPDAIDSGVLSFRDIATTEQQVEPEIYGTFVFVIKWQPRKMCTQGRVSCSASTSSWIMGNNTHQIRLTTNSPILKFSWKSDENYVSSEWDWLIYEEHRDDVKPTRLVLYADSSILCWNIDMRYSTEAPKAATLPMQTFFLPEAN